MSLSRISSRFPRIVSAQCQNSIVTSSRHHPLPVPINQFHSLGESHYKVVGGQVFLFHHSLLNAYAFQRFGFSSVPSPKNPKEENSPPPGDGGNTVENSGATTKASGDAEAPQQREAPVSEDSLKELTMEDLVKLVIEKVEPLREKHEEIEKMQHTCADMVKLVTQKEVLLKGKHKDIEKMQNKVLRTCADMVNVAEKARGEAERAFLVSGLAIADVIVVGEMDVVIKILLVSPILATCFCKLLIRPSRRNLKG